VKQSCNQTQVVWLCEVYKTKKEQGFLPALSILAVIADRTQIILLVTY